jgi:hypothetical protein
VKGFNARLICIDARISMARCGLRVIDELLAHDPHSSALHVRRVILLQLSSMDRPLEEAGTGAPECMCAR